jgi:hypothetical protein
MAKLTIEVDEGIVMLRVDGELIGLVQEFSLSVGQSTVFHPKGRVDFLNYEKAGDRTEELLKKLPWLELHVERLQRTLDTRLPLDLGGTSELLPATLPSLGMPTDPQTPTAKRSSHPPTDDIDDSGEAPRSGPSADSTDDVDPLGD